MKKIAYLLCVTLIMNISIIFTSCAKQSNLDNQMETNFVNSIDVSVEKIEVGKHIEYGSYELKKGDTISCDITWSNNDGNLYFAVGTEYGNFDNGLISSGTDVCSLKETIEITKEGMFYIFIGSQNTDNNNIEDVKGTIVISSN